MSTNYPICTYSYDTGGLCNSAAVKNEKYCAFHLRHRAHLMRIAKARACNQRFDLNLPPLESMHAVQAALSQINQALAADMIDLKRADRLIRVLTVASRNLLKADKWPAASVFHSDQPAEIDVAAEYGLPKDLDLSRSPEDAFPQSVILSEERSDESKSRRFAGVGAGSRDPERAERVEGDPFVAADARGLQHGSGPPPLPFSGNYCGDHHSDECECVRIRPDYPLTPEMVEVVETAETYGPEVAAARSKQLLRNAERRRLNRDRKRYAAIALERNMRRAAERIAELKLAECSQQAELAARKSPASVPADSQPATESGAKAALTPTG